MDLPPPIAEALASLFPVITPRAKLAITEARLEGERLHALAELTVLEGGQVEYTAEQEIDLGPASDVDLVATAARVRERLDASPLVGVFPQQLTRAPTPYRRVRPSTADDAGVRLWDLRARLREQALSHGFEERFEVMGDWPVEPRTVYFLHLADAMLGGNGLEVFLDQAAGEEVTGVLAALEEVGCAGLGQLYREGLAIVAKRGRGADELDPDWVAREKRKPRPKAWKSWRALDSHEEGGTYALLQSELKPKLEAYLERHRESLEGE